MVNWLDYGSSKGSKRNSGSDIFGGGSRGTQGNSNVGSSGDLFGSLLTALAIFGSGVYQANKASKDAKKMSEAISNNTVQTPAETPSPTLAQETAVKSTKDTRRKVAANKGIFTKQEDGFSSNASLVRKTILGG